MVNTDEISKSIASLRAENSADSVTPERVGRLLQAITDLVKALSLVPEEEIVSVMAAVRQAQSDAAAAVATSQAAVEACQSQTLSGVSFAADGEKVTMTVRMGGLPAGQAGGALVQAVLPVASAVQAGVVVPGVLEEIAAAATAAGDAAIASLLLSYTTTGVTLGLRNGAGATLQKTIGAASASRAGVMSKADKVKLDGLPESVVGLDASGRVPGANAPAVMLRNIADQSGYWDEHPLQPGDYWLDGGHVWYHASNAADDVDMGAPSKNVVYCHVDSNILYRWTGERFVPLLTDPNYAMDTVEVRRNNTSQMVYSVPNGVLATVKATTATVNIALEGAATGASVHRLLLLAEDFGSVSALNWPGGLRWKDYEELTLQEVTNGYGVLVTIVDRQWAEFNSYR